MDQIILEGSVESIIYRNDINGFTVFSVKPSIGLSKKEKFDEIICTATVPDINIGENARLSGSYVMHPSYGRQFSAAFFEKKMPESTDGITKYLASGVIKGIGEKTAKRIVDRFGEKTLSILEEHPERLCEIKGITPEKARTIGTIIQEQALLRHTMIFLQTYGISPIYSQKIFKKYKDSTIEVISTNPYILADDIVGIGFKTSDIIAAKLGMERDSSFRIKSGIKYCLNEALGNGHVFLPREILIRQSVELLGVDVQSIENALAQLQFERVTYQDSVNEVNVIYLNSYFYMENYVARKLSELAMNKSSKTNMEIIAENIKKAEKETGTTLAENQKEAVTMALMCGVLVVTGGPGTGKTTTINTIIKLLNAEERKIELAAPTGRAAKRMSEATGFETKTIHRLLGSSFSEGSDSTQQFEKNEDSPLEADIIIIDESSMVDISLMYHLLRATDYGTKLILVGDVDQLPSVGAGNVLKDIIQSEMVPVVRLTEIFRQARQSAIVMNAHRINHGEYPILNEKGSDFFFVKRHTAESVSDSIVELITQRLPNFNNCDSLKDIQVLTPMRKSILGVSGLNPLLQRALNPPHPSKAEKEMRSMIYREGDKVMQIKNNYNMQWRVLDDLGRQVEEGTGVFNGDEGLIKKIDDVNETIRVKFDDGRIVTYDYSQLDELELSYAITIHKSQGSEYRVIVIPMYSGPPMLMSRNLLYTAVTRAKELAVIVGMSGTLYRMVDNNSEINRYTSLCERIKKLTNVIGGCDSVN